MIKVMLQWDKERTVFSVNAMGCTGYTYVGKKKPDPYLTMQRKKFQIIINEVYRRSERKMSSYLEKANTF